MHHAVAVSVMEEKFQGQGGFRRASSKSLNGVPAIAMKNYLHHPHPPTPPTSRWGLEHPSETGYPRLPTPKREEAAAMTVH